MKSRVALAVAIALAILAAVGLKVYMIQKDREKAATQRLIPVLVMKKNLNKGQVFTSDMAEVEQVDQAVAQGRAPVFPDQLLKFANSPIQKSVRAREILFQDHFITESALENPAKDMTPGDRQVTVPVDKVTGLAGRLIPGSIVDVIVTMRAQEDASGPAEPVTQTALTGMLVIATDLNVERPLSARERREYASYSTVTLRANSKEAEILAHISKLGEIQLILRGVGDDTGLDRPAKLEKVTPKSLDKMIQEVVTEKSSKPPKKLEP